MPDFAALSLSVNLAIFVAAAAAVWFAGTRIARFADEIAQRTGLGEAVVGLLLLAGVTSLPEVATSFTAARSGDAPLAVNNLLGSIALQIALLAFGDAIYSKRALTSIVPDPIVILQGALNVSLLSLVAMGAVAGDAKFLGAGAWTWGLFIAAGWSIFKLTEARERKPWLANTEKDGDARRIDRKRLEISMTALIARTVAAAAAILFAGYVVAQSGQEIADKSGLGSSFMGVAFVALATSLPEASTVFAAMRRGLYTMAISDILGTNILNVALLFGVDLIAAGPPVMNVVGPFAALAAMLGAATTGIFLMGIAERRDRTILRMGVDSFLVIVIYLGGLALLFSMRGSA